MSRWRGSDGLGVRRGDIFNPPSESPITLELRKLLPRKDTSGRFGEKFFDSGIRAKLALERARNAVEATESPFHSEADKAFAAAVAGQFPKGTPLSDISSALYNQAVRVESIQRHDRVVGMVDHLARALGEELPGVDTLQVTLEQRRQLEENHGIAAEDFYYFSHVAASRMESLGHTFDLLEEYAKGDQSHNREALPDLPEIVLAQFERVMHFLPKQGEDYKTRKANIVHEAKIIGSEMRLSEESGKLVLASELGDIAARKAERKAEERYKSWEAMEACIEAVWEDTNLAEKLLGSGVLDSKRRLTIAREATRLLWGKKDQQGHQLVVVPDALLKAGDIYRNAVSTRRPLLDSARSVLERLVYLAPDDFTLQKLNIHDVNKSKMLRENQEYWLRSRYPLQGTLAELDAQILSELLGKAETIVADIGKAAKEQMSDGKDRTVTIAGKKVDLSHAVNILSTTDANYNQSEGENREMTSDKVEALNKLLYGILLMRDELVVNETTKSVLNTLGGVRDVTEQSAFQALTSYRLQEELQKIPRHWLGGKAKQHVGTIRIEDPVDCMYEDGPRSLRIQLVVAEGAQVGKIIKLLDKLNQSQALGMQLELGNPERITLKGDAIEAEYFGFPKPVKIF